MKIALTLVISTLLIGCATEARLSAYSSCNQKALQKYPIQSVPQKYWATEYFQKQEGMTCSRIPSGFYNEGGMNCEPKMRTYKREVEKTKYVDQNKNARQRWANSCADDQCRRNYGNVDCE